MLKGIQEYTIVRISIQKTYGDAILANVISYGI